MRGNKLEMEIAALRNGGGEAFSSYTAPMVGLGA